MAKNPIYSLAIDNIEASAKEFVQNAGSDYSFSFDESKPNQKRITITKGRDSGILICFIKGGQISFQAQGKEALKPICEKCKDYIIEATKIEIVNRKSYALRNVEEDDFTACIDVFDELGYGIERKVVTDNSMKHFIKIKGKYNDEITISYYNNKTLFIQGKITPIFLDFIVHCTPLLSTNDTVGELKALLSIENDECKIIDKNLNSHIPTNYDKLGDKLETFLKTSLLLINNIIELPDYSSYCYSSLRALEGIIKKRIIEEAGTFSDFGDYFAKKDGVFSLKENSRPFDNQLTCDSLEETYNYLNKNRHSLFHVDDSIETSRTLTFDESVEITKECLRLISNVCRNWD